MKKHKHLNDRTLLYAFIWVFCYFLSLIVLRELAIPKAVGIGVTVVTIASFGVFLYKYYRSISVMDEVSIKIQMEAVVISFSLVLLLLMTLGMLELFIVISKDDWSYRHLVPFFLAFYCIGLFISRSKYNFTDDEEHD